MTDERDENGALHQIGEVAEIVGLSLRTIRHYDEVGVVPPSGRSTGGFRLYTEADIDRLRLVKHMKPLEFTLEQMKELLQARDRLASCDDAAEARELRDRVAMYAAAADQRCERLREQLAQVEEFASMLRTEARPSGRTPRTDTTRP
ncbi:MAG TPA: MerR family transcriptional regulator [Acidimicrobiales bacterium]